MASRSSDGGGGEGGDNVWSVLNINHLEQIQARFLSGTPTHLQDNSSSPGKYFQPELLVGIDDLSVRAESEHIIRHGVSPGGRRD